MKKKSKWASKDINKAWREPSSVLKELLGQKAYGARSNHRTGLEVRKFMHKVRKEQLEVKGIKYIDARKRDKDE